MDGAIRWSISAYGDIYVRNNIAAMLCFVEEPNDGGLFFPERERKKQYVSL